MAQKKISELGVAATIVGSDVVAIVEGGVTKKVVAEKVLMVRSLTDVRWQSVRITPEATKLAGVNDPDYAVFKKDLPDTSQGVFLYWFDDTLEEELFFSFEAPLKYKEGTDIYVEVYWTPKANGGAGEVVCWGLEHTYANEGDVFGLTDLDYKDTAAPAGDLIAATHYHTSLTTHAGAGGEVGQIHVCRLFRDATGAGGTDDYTDDVGLVGIGLRYQVDAIGASSKDAK